MFVITIPSIKHNCNNRGNLIRENLEILNIFPAKWHFQSAHILQIWILNTYLIQLLPYGWAIQYSK